MFTLVWATSLEEDANRISAPALFIPALPFIRFDTSGKRPSNSYKRNAVKKFAGDRPLAWLDDEVGDDMRAWAKKAAHPDAHPGDRSPGGTGRKTCRKLNQFAKQLADFLAVN